MVGSREGAGVVVGEVMLVVGGCVCVCWERGERDGEGVLDGGLFGMRSRGFISLLGVQIA